MDGDSGLKFGMIRMVLRMMARITLIRDGAVGLKKDGKWNGVLDGGEGGEDDHDVD